ncbi:PilN domain-containing protein [Sinimarinibacterium flocculans]|uniref:PilN domain-containing protein n=1 Tax=Sinimarinibacterium flocculans TaxID=985250 RepID=UPI00351149AF
MHIEIDFSDRISPYRVLGWLAVALAVLGLSTVGVATHKTNARIVEVERRLIASVEGQPPNGLDSTISFMQEARRISATLHLSWDELLEAFESAVSQDVLLVELTTSAGQAGVRMTGVARNVESLLAYADRLRASPMLSEVQVVQHELDQQNATLPVSFEARAQWLSASPLLRRTDQ